MRKGEQVGTDKERKTAQSRPGKRGGSWEPSSKREIESSWVACEFSAKFPHFYQISASSGSWMKFIFV